MTATIPVMAPVTMGDRCSKVGKLVAVSWGHTDQDGDDSEDEGDDAVAALHAVSADGSHEGCGGGEPWQERPQDDEDATKQGHGGAGHDGVAHQSRRGRRRWWLGCGLPGLRPL